MKAILQPRRDDAYDAGMPFGSVETKRVVVAGFRIIDACKRLVPHLRFHFAPLPVQAVELARGAERNRFIVGGETSDADGHVGEPRS